MALYLDVSAKVIFHCLQTQKWGMKLGIVDGACLWTVKYWNVSIQVPTIGSYWQRIQEFVSL